MKLAFIIALFSQAALANQITNHVKVDCVMNDVTTLRQFSLQATFDKSTGSFENKDLDITLRSLGPDRQTNEVNLTRDGMIVDYPGDIITKNPFVLISSFDKNSDVTLVNLLVDYPTPLASVVRLNSGETFRSTCKSIK